MRFASTLAFATLLVATDGFPAESPAPAFVSTQFQFHSAFLMNLHHFLVDATRHPGRIDKVQWMQPPTADEMATMRVAVAFYTATFGQRDLLFDDGLRDIKHALARAEDARQQADGLGLPPALVATLDSAAPIYARCLWARDDQANRRWIAQAQALEARYGAQIQPRLERIFDATFPAVVRDDVVFNTGTFTGAYTDAPPPQTVLPSGWEEYGGLASLEMIWHEAAHVEPGDHLETLIEQASHEMGRELPDGLWHAALFEAVGTQVAQVLAADGHGDYVAYADKNGVYRRGWAKYVPLLHAEWKTWLDGQGSLQQAVDAMVAKQPRVVGSPSVAVER
jgi:hypothetical protein